MPLSNAHVTAERPLTYFISTMMTLHMHGRLINSILAPCTCLRATHPGTALQKPRLFTNLILQQTIKNVGSNHSRDSFTSLRKLSASPAYIHSAFSFLCDDFVEFAYFLLDENPPPAQLFHAAGGGLRGRYALGVSLSLDWDL